MEQNTENIRILSIFHYVLSGLVALISCVPIIHLTIGIVFIVLGNSNSFKTNDGEEIPSFFGWIFVIIASLIILIGWTIAILIFKTGRFLSKRVNRTFCLVIAGFECIFIPYGTALGVFSLVTLTKESVRKLFDSNSINTNDFNQ